MLGGLQFERTRGICTRLLQDGGRRARTRDQRERVLEARRAAYHWTDDERPVGGTRNFRWVEGEAAHHPGDPAAGGFGVVEVVRTIQGDPLRLVDSGHDR